MSSSLSESGRGPPFVNHSSSRWRFRSSLAFIWFLVNFFFFLGAPAVGGVDGPSLPLPAGVPAGGVAAGVATRDANLDVGFDLASRNASSMTALLP